MAAIMYTDMVGYTALGQRNESLSLALVDEQRNLIRPILSRHNGREVKTMGDAFLVEFPSALDAIRCAYDIQRAIRELNFSLPEDRRIHLRVGVHLGDVVESDGDISGDAVNVASRIEPLAEDGGVCLSRQVSESVQGKFELPLVSLGLKTLKNVLTPMEVFKISMPWDEPRLPGFSRLDVKRVAVLPFENMSPDTNDAYFANGMTEELITTLSKIGQLTTIGRTSVMRFRNSTKGVGEVARELNSGSLVEGSVRKAGNKVRITVKLLDVNTEGNVWAETYDRNFDDIFEIQTDVAKRVVEALQVKLLASEMQRIEKKGSDSTEAYTLYLKGRNYVNERTRQGFERAMKYFEAAVEHDRNYASAYTGLADCYHLMENWGFMHPSVAWPKSKNYASKALAIDDGLAEAHTSMAMALAILDWDWKGAEDEYKRALSINPNYVTAHHWYAVHLLVAQKRWDEAIREMTAAQGLDPFAAVIVTNLGRVLFTSGREEEGIEKYRRALEIDPNFAYAHLLLGVALVRMSSVSEGLTEITAADALSPGYIAAKTGLAYAFAQAGRKSDAREIIERLLRDAAGGYVPSTWIGGAYSAIGDTDQAFEWLDKAAMEHSSAFPEYYSEPVFDSIARDPRMGVLLKSIGLE
ncbi:MAG TPA: tetratricopeptide repeat protein [Nitrososphaerales archaeon]|nr:tetratricopeptide repeat protein [Nitrososphaerales archaeon]